MDQPAVCVLIKCISSYTRNDFLATFKQVWQSSSPFTDGTSANVSGFVKACQKDGEYVLALAAQDDIGLLAQVSNSVCACVRVCVCLLVLKSKQMLSSSAR